MDDQAASLLEPGLYVVATPIGNLADISFRAIDVLGRVSVIAAEDTRVSRRLLDHYGITTALESFHAHNEHARSEQFLRRMRAGEAVALISDAGSPLISDPGFPLVQAAIAAGVAVVPVPGACAVVAALSVAGLPTHAFAFEGFLPARAAERRRRLQQLLHEPRTLVFYESSHRIAACMRDLQEVFGPDRPVVLARELTKRFETVLRGSLSGIAAQVQSEPDQQKGEFVLMLGEGQAKETAADASQLLSCLLQELPASRAAQVAARYLGRPRRELYALALQLADSGDETG